MNRWSSSGVSTRPRTRGALGALLLLVVLARPAHGQGLRVRVVDDSTGAPVRDAWVTLMNEGAVFGEGLTRPNGVRFFPADPAREYSVVVERVGLKPHESPPFHIAQDTVEVRVPAKPIAFARVDDGSSCGEPRDGLSAQLWRQVRIALSGAEQVSSAGLELLALRRHERVLDRDGNMKIETTVDGRALGTRLFATSSPAELSRAGFIVPDSVGDRVYLGPSIQYLLSSEFLEDHCFAAVQGRDATHGMLGLRFQPRPGAKVATLTGALWADQVTGELRLLEFAWIGRLPADARGIGGRVLFDRLPSGSWIAREWTTRTPIATQAGQLLGYRVHGGEALSVPPAMMSVADSIENARRNPGRITGVVMDSLTNRGMPGALVFTDMQGPRARTELDGTFVLRSVPAGWRQVRFSHPSLDSIGVRPASRTVRVGPDSTSHVVLGAPSLRTLKGGACTDSLAILTGTVRDVTSRAPIDSAIVSLSWVDVQFTPGKPLRVEPVEAYAATDSTGRYAYCVPPQLEITVAAQAAGLRTGRVDVRPDERRVTVLDLALDRTAKDTMSGDATIRGVVLYQDGRPISPAWITLSEPVVTESADSAGRFRFSGIPGGTRVLDVRALGHAPARAVVTAAPGDTGTVRIYLRSVTTLDAIVVRASAGVAGRALREIEERRREGVGYRLTPVELLGFRTSRLESVVRSLPFVRVRSSPRGLAITLPSSTGRDCTPTIWLDGARSSAEVLELYGASDALAVEVITRAAQLPPRYRTSSSCGAILVWTRAANR